MPPPPRRRGAPLNSSSTTTTTGTTSGGQALATTNNNTTTGSLNRSSTRSLQATSSPTRNDTSNNNKRTNNNASRNVKVQSPQRNKKMENTADGGKRARSYATTNNVVDASSSPNNNSRKSKSNGNDVPAVPATVPKASFLSERRFTNVNVASRISDTTKKALRDNFGHEYLSKVQALTFDHLMSGKDVFVKSKTGSGKTMAFLLPMIERAYLSRARTAALPPPYSSAPYARAHTIVLSPTKELAAQTFEEARKLLPPTPGSSGTGMRAALVIGGNDKKKDMRTLSSYAAGDIAVLVATPGRLNDYVQTAPDGFKERVIANVSSIVLDEADRMLDAGFRQPLENILNAASSSSVAQRQTVLVSATMPASVLELSRKYMRPDSAVIDVAALSGTPEDDNEPEARVNPDVRHRALVVSHTLFPHALLHALCEHAASNATAFKIVVFFPFKRQVQLMAALLRKVTPSCLSSDTKLLEIHADLDQKVRNRASDDFRQSSRAVLMGTDVIARGVDYPDVTLVLQMGLTDRETYVHRVGRTGRAGKKGDALLVLAPFEEASMRKRLDGFGVEWLRESSGHAGRIDNNTTKKNNSGSIKKTNLNSYSNAKAKVNTTAKGDPSSSVTITVKPELNAAAAKLVSEEGGLFRRAYGSWLGFYGSESHGMGVPEPQLETEAAAAFAALGLKEPPALTPELRKKMGYK